MTVDKGKIHIYVGDTQVKSDVPTDHLGWIGTYVAEHFFGQDIVLIHAGDHWDMPSLCSYDKGKKEMEGRRYTADVEAGNAGMSRLCAPIAAEIRRRKKPWKFRKVFTLGNHENRIARASSLDPQLDGVISFEDFNLKEWGWEVHDFLEPVIIDGIHYAHYFYNPNTSRPYSGENLLLRLKQIGHSFSMGHQQGLHVASRHVGNTRHQALVNGSCYLHDENYLGPQGNNYWRGIVVCHQVENGTYDRMEVSLDYLCRRYENKKLMDFLK